MRCGLLGQKLGHSYSPDIHALLGRYSYELMEVEPEDLGNFLQNGSFDGLNVTIPYKKAVIPFLDALSPIAQRLGAVNTIVRVNGRLMGDNTDYCGFSAMLRSAGLSPTGKKCLVLGSGGASAVVQAVLEEAGAQVVVVSRSGIHHYQNLDLHSDASILVNTTPVGMCPNNGEAPLSLTHFPRLEGVLDLIYNPARTRLLMEAEAMGIPAFNGLRMLVAQAMAAAQMFTNTPVPVELEEEIYRQIAGKTENIVLVGMPGCGKTTIGKALADKLGKQFADSDALVEKMAQKNIPRIFAEDGETVLRQWETKALAILGQQTGLVIATGGGCVTRQENYPLLHQNGRILWIQRDLNQLATQGRPLSQSQNLQEMYRHRAPLYAAFADQILTNAECSRILEVSP